MVEGSHIRKTNLALLASEQPKKQSSLPEDLHWKPSTETERLTSFSFVFSYRTFVLLKHVGPKDLGEEEICRSYLCCTCSSSLNMGPIVGVWMSNMLHSRLQGRPYTKALPVMSCNFQRKFITVKWKTPYRRTTFPRHPHRQQHRLGSRIHQASGKVTPFCQEH